MLTAKVRELGKQLQTTQLTRESASSPSMQRTPSLSRISAESAKPLAASEDTLARELKACGFKDDGAPLAAACQKALSVLHTSFRPSARARKLAEMDAFYKKQGRQSPATPVSRLK